MLKESKKLISTVVKNFDFVLFYTKYNLASAMEFRFNFFSQAFFMIINDTMFFLLWYFFFEHFGKLNGFGFREMIAIWIFAAGSYGWVNAIFGNANNLGKIISNGGLDFYFTFPKNHLLHALVSKTDLSAWGDMMFALLAFVLFFPITVYSCAWLIVGWFFSSLILLSFYIIVGSLSFWLGRNEVLHNNLMHAFIAFSSNPSSVVQGFLKFFIFFVIPAGFATFLPAELLQTFALDKFIYVVIFSIIFFIITIFIYNRGLKKYSSGNLINIRS